MRVLASTGSRHITAITVSITMLQTLYMHIHCAQTQFDAAELLTNWFILCGQINVFLWPFLLTLKSFPLFVAVSHSVCFSLLVSKRTLSLWLSPPGPGSYNRNNEQLFGCVAANQTRFTKKDSRGQGWLLSLSVFASYNPHEHTHVLFFMTSTLTYAPSVEGSPW